MVFLVLTRKGYESYRALGSSAGALWVAAEVLSSEELVALRNEGVNVSNFNYTIEQHETDVIAGAVETINEHHPGEVLWVES